VFRGGLAGDIAKLALGLDLMVPPLTVFLAALMAVFFLSGLLALAGAAAAFSLSFLALGLFGAALIIGWVRFGQATLPPSQIGAVVQFLGSKLRVYGRDARRSTKTWTRTERDGEDRE
jgi:hypothetical protein